MGSDSRSLVKLGFIAGVYGVRGWVKVHSFTEPRAGIVEYGHWILRLDGRDEAVELEAGRPQGKTIVAKLENVEDRDQAAALTGAEIFVERSALPPCEPSEYYWADLEGLIVEDAAGNELGRVDHMIETGAHDVMVLAGEPERLIPFALGEIVTDVDLERGAIVVNWDASYWQE